MKDYEGVERRRRFSFSQRYPFNEFIVDFLGGLVPGSLFTIGAGFALLPPVYLIFRISAKRETASLTDFLSNFFRSIQNTPNMLWIAFFALFVAISYVLGHLFYRIGPKKTDRKSFTKAAKKLIINRLTEKVPRGFNIKYIKASISITIKKIKNFFKCFFDPENNEFDLSKHHKFLKRELACTSEQECEFPYPNLKDYLGYRGHCHLCPFVIWKDDKKKFNRSKTYINLLKIRLKSHYPERCSVIIRNEAHVRLASSSWYVSYALRFCSALGMLAVIFAIIMSQKIQSLPNSSQISYTTLTFILFSIPPFIVFLTGEYIRRKIESFMHYQRLREVFYVLETAYSAFTDKPNLLKPPFLEYEAAFDKDKCKHKCEYK